MTDIGYSRVSTDDQSLDIQRAMLLEAGCKRVFEEKQSGKDADSRAELQACLRFLAEGDTLVVTKLDRLARNTVDMLQIIIKLGKRGVSFRSLAEPWANTDTPAAELMLTVFAGFAQFERARIRERQREGIAAAKAAGKYKGRKRKQEVTAETVRPLKLQGLGPKAIADKLGCSRMTVYRTGVFADVA